MRPARGRAAAAAAAAAISSGPQKRTCVVRLEKVVQSHQPQQQQQQNRSNEAEDDRKKMTGPLKKRPVVMKKTPPGRQASRRRAADEDLSEYMLVTARAKRISKPNPKYSNDDIVTPRIRTKEHAEDSETEAEEAYRSTDADEELPDETSEEEFAPMTLRGSVPLANGEIVKRRRGRPPKAHPEQTSTPKLPLKRKMDFESASKDLESILAQNKRLNIELYDASDSDTSSVTPARRVVRSSTAQQTQLQRPVSRLAVKPPQQHEPKPKQPELPTRRTELRRVQSVAAKARPAITSEDEDDPDDYRGTQATASTIDDFETMPTFTIVNINDIINKKGDVMIEQTNPPKTNSRVSTVQRNNNDDSSSNQSRNRRKTMHTTILSDKIDPEKLKTPPPRTPFPPRKPVVSHNALANSLSKSLLNNSQAYNSAPRILNNVLCRRTKALQAKQEQLEEQKLQHQQQQQHKPLPKPVEFRADSQLQSKENHLNNFRSAAVATTTTTAASSQSLQSSTPASAAPSNRKLPLSKVVVQRQGNKIIKKITCFETWYVINLPNIEAPLPKHKFDMSLMHLANNLKDIALPTDNWSYKVNLQKIGKNMIVKLDEVFTGEVQDPGIDEADKHNYQPISVMFRRNSQNPKLRMPYDRAVIFKNQSYYTNIDGKNVRLVGSPLAIGSLDEIEVLLQLIDEMTLQSPFVEQVSCVL